MNQNPLSLFHSCLRRERAGKIIIMLTFTLLLLNVLYVLIGQEDIGGKDPTSEAFCVAVAGLLHACVLSGSFSSARAQDAHVWPEIESPKKRFLHLLQHCFNGTLVQREMLVCLLYWV